MNAIRIIYQMANCGRWNRIWWCWDFRWNWNKRLVGIQLTMLVWIWSSVSECIVISLIVCWNVCNPCVRGILAVYSSRCCMILCRSTTCFFLFCVSFRQICSESCPVMTWIVQKNLLYIGFLTHSSLANTKSTWRCKYVLWSYVELWLSIFSWNNIYR